MTVQENSMVAIGPYTKVHPARGTLTVSGQGNQGIALVCTDNNGNPVPSGSRSDLIAVVNNPDKVDGEAQLQFKGEFTLAAPHGTSASNGNMKTKNIEAAATPSELHKGPRHPPYEHAVSEVVKKLKNEPFLFVIAIAALLSGLVVLATALGKPDLTFVIIVVAFLAWTVIIGYFIIEVRRKVVDQGSEIKEIQIALKGVVTKHELGPLKGLMDAAFQIRYEPDLYGYLHRLDGLNFIQPNPGCGLYDIVKEHEEDLKKHYSERPPFDLKKYVYITDDGKTYLKVREAAGAPNL
jgi:hypothetical protein